MKFDIIVFFENLSRKVNFHYNTTRITGTLHEDQHTFMIISRSGLRRMKNASASSCKENQNTVSRLAFHPEIVPFLSDKVQKCGTVRQATHENVIPRMRIVCRITKATDIYIQVCNNYCLSTERNGYANTPLGYIYTYIASLATSFFTHIPSVCGN